jgi:ribosome-binding factor A
VNVSRAQRLASLFREELNRLLQRGVKDPRLYGVSVTRVELTEDCRYARVLFTCLADQSGADDATKAFQRATGYFRGQLGRNLRVRQIPELRFVHDRILHEATEVRMAIDRIVEQDREAQIARGEDPDAEPDEEVDEEV